MTKTSSIHFSVEAIPPAALIAIISVGIIAACAASAAPNQPGFVVHEFGKLPTDRLDGLTVPDRLPAGIHDPTLIEAWIRLYNNQTDIPLWDNSHLTARALAQFVLDQSIPVVWDVSNVCRGGSCSIRYCSGEICDFDDGQLGVEPICVRTGERGDMPALVATLAHEALHRTQPFGAVHDTRFEEYWAFRVEGHITAEAWLKFGNYDPLDHNHLSMWIRENKLDPYLELAAYPASIEPLAYGGSSQSSTDNGKGGPTQAWGID